MFPRIVDLPCAAAQRALTVSHIRELPGRRTSGTVHEPPPTNGHSAGRHDMEVTMTIRLDHTIVPAKDRVASAEFFAEIFGLTVTPDSGHFAQVQVNESLTLDFAD